MTLEEKILLGIYCELKIHNNLKEFAIVEGEPETEASVVDMRKTVYEKAMKWANGS